MLYADCLTIQGIGIHATAQQKRATDSVLLSWLLCSLVSEDEIQGLLIVLLFELCVQLYSASIVYVSDLSSLRPSYMYAVYLEDFMKNPVLQAYLLQN